MLHFIGFIFIIIIAVLLIGLSLLASIITRLFGGKRGGGSSWRVYTSGRRPDNGNGRSAQSSSGRLDEQEASGKRKKIFSDDEGEYVDFEEVKD